MTERTVTRTDWTDRAVVATVLVAGIGFVVGSAVLVLSATIPLWFALAGITGSRPTVPIQLHREIDGSGASPAGSDSTDTRSTPSGDPIDGDPGDTLPVRTTVENTGSEPVVDLRLIDGVPEDLPVVDGSPRACLTLDPGETATIEYDLELHRGDYTFDQAVLRTRNVSGTVAETWHAEATGDAALSCRPPVETVPLSGGTNDFAGSVPTDEGGSGVEFHSVREYEPGDPVVSIDWRRYARTRDLTTVEYRAERATRIVCIVDARQSQRLGIATDRLSACELSADAAQRTFETLVDAGHPTGVVAIGDGNLESVSPGTDPATRQVAADLFDAARSTMGLSGTGLEYWSQASNSFGDIITHLPARAQIYLFSSFVDDAPVAFVRRARQEHHPVRVVSPDVIDGETIESRYGELARENRLAHARATGARVIDWDRDQPLGIVLSNTLSGGSVR